MWIFQPWRWGATAIPMLKSLWPSLGRACRLIAPADGYPLCIHICLWLRPFPEIISPAPGSRGWSLSFSMTQPFTHVVVSALCVVSGSSSLVAQTRRSPYPGKRAFPHHDRSQDRFSLSSDRSSLHWLCQPWQFGYCGAAPPAVEARHMERRRYANHVSDGHGGLDTVTSRRNSPSAFIAQNVS